jgi:uncharacterized protein (DUF934 family)
MTALIRNGRLSEDRFTRLDDGDPLPATGGILVSLERWLGARAELLARQQPLGVRLRSDQHPAAIAGDLRQLALVALEFPVFKDGRAYSYARLLRERWHFSGELRAIGDVLLEQLHFMERVGFDAFELKGSDPVRAWQTASREFSTWYQATADGRVPARFLRHSPPQARKIA